MIKIGTLVRHTKSPYRGIPRVVIFSDDGLYKLNAHMYFHLFEDLFIYTDIFGEE